MPGKTPVEPEYGRLMLQGLAMGLWAALKILWPYLLVLLAVWMFKVGAAQALFRRFRRSRELHSAGSGSVRTAGSVLHGALKEWSDDRCAECGKAVSHRVAQFCLDRPGRFGGRIYCFDHQRNYRRS